MTSPKPSSITPEACPDCGNTENSALWAVTSSASIARAATYNAVKRSRTMFNPKSSSLDHEPDII